MATTAYPLDESQGLGPQGAAFLRQPGVARLLDTLPFPALWLRRDGEILGRNLAATKSYGPVEGHCHRVSHGLPQPCDRNEEDCPLRRLGPVGTASCATHTHRTEAGYRFFHVTAVALVNDEVLEIHVPLDECLSRDPLTGAFTRPFFERIVRREMVLLDRLKACCALLMVDVDGLKHINDAHGHPAGDEVLRAVGQTLRKVARATDIVGRFGGDEFCLCLPRINRQEALAVANRIRRTLHTVHLPGPLAELRVSASLGLHWMPRGQSLDEALARADRALYRAKRAGRDRVVAG